KRPEWQGLDPARWRPLAGAAGVVAFENQQALPRAWRVEAVAARSPEEVDRTLTQDPGFEPLKTALVESPVNPGPYSPGTAEAESVGLNRIRLTTSGEGPGYVVLSESYDPGWTAELDGRAQAVHRTDALLLGVEVPAGAHEILFSYEPRRWKAGLLGSGLALLVLLAWAARSRRRGDGQGPGVWSGQEVSR
ncbi:MAG: YfhO family protein, partial [Candidatus Sericytochromatia bacterium]